MTSTKLSAGNREIPEGGSEFTAASGKTLACNGRHGRQGACCQKKRTETGSWGISAAVGSITSVLAVVSFTLRSPRRSNQATCISLITKKQAKAQWRGARAQRNILPPNWASFASSKVRSRVAGSKRKK